MKLCSANTDESKTKTQNKPIRLHRFHGCEKVCGLTARKVRSNQPHLIPQGISDKGLKKKCLDEEHFAPRLDAFRTSETSPTNTSAHCQCENETDILHSALTLLLSKESMTQCFTAHTPVLTFIAPKPSPWWLLKEGSHKTWRHYTHYMTSNTLHQNPWQLHSLIQAEAAAHYEAHINRLKLIVRWLTIITEK